MPSSLVTDYGADPTGVLPSDDAFDDAFLAVGFGGVVNVPPGEYKLTRTLNIGLAGDRAHRLIGIGKPTLKFYGLPSTNDAVYAGGSFHAQIVVENLIINPQATGLDGFVLGASDQPIIHNVLITNAGRNGFAIRCSDYQWVENGNFEQIECHSNGLHGFYLYTGGVNGAFINETIFKLCEVRSVSLRANGGAAVYAEATGTSPGSKMSNLIWDGCNFDSRRSLAIAEGFDTNPHPMYLKFTAGGNNTYETWKIISGGWEDISPTPDYREYGIIYAEPGCSTRGWFVTGIVSANWSRGGYILGETALVQDVHHGALTYQGHMQSSALSRNSGYFSATASTTATFEIPFNGAVRGFKTSDFTGTIVRLTFAHSRWFSGGGPAMIGAMYTYSVLLGKNPWGSGDYFILPTGALGAAFTIDNIHYDFANSKFVVTYTTSADFGAGGGNYFIFWDLDSTCNSFIPIPT